MPMPADTMTLPIEDMSCEHCAQRVQEALTGVEGVTGASVNLGDAEATVTVRGSVSRERLADAVEDVGYGVPATP